MAFVPGHHVIGNRTRAHAGRGIGLHALEVAHQPPPRSRRHACFLCCVVRSQSPFLQAFCLSLIVALLVCPGGRWTAGSEVEGEFG